MALNPFRTRREQREEQELEVFRAVRQAAREEVRNLARHTDQAPHSLDAARTALEAATTCAEVVALEPLVRAARFALGLTEPEGRRGYQALVGAARAAPQDRLPDQRVTDLRHQKRLDMGRGDYTPES